MIFSKNSTRTRVSFEAGMFQLGGHALFLANSVSQIGRGEPVQDTTRVLSRYCDGIMIRTFDQEEVEGLAAYGTIPVINGLTDFAHPCQVLADLMTIREYKARLEGLKICYIGDGNNMANSIIVGGLKCGMDVSIATPKGYEPDQRVLDFAKTVTDAKFQLTTDPMEAAQGADAVFTDVWASMGQEGEKAERGERLCGLPDQRPPFARRQARLHGAALPARPPGRGDHRGGAGGPRRRDLRRGGKPPPRPEGRPGPSDAVRKGKSTEKRPPAGVLRRAAFCGALLFHIHGDVLGAVLLELAHIPLHTVHDGVVILPGGLPRSRRASSSARISKKVTSS